MKKNWSVLAMLVVIVFASIGIVGLLLTQDLRLSEQPIPGPAEFPNSAIVDPSYPEQQIPSFIAIDDQRPVEKRGKIMYMSLPHDDGKELRIYPPVIDWNPKGQPGTGGTADPILQGVGIDKLTPTSAKIIWNTIGADTVGVDLFWKNPDMTTGWPEWRTIPSGDGEHVFTDLDPDREYGFSIVARTDGGGMAHYEGTFKTRPEEKN